MFDTEKCRSRFREIIESIEQKAQLSINYEKFGESLLLVFYNLLDELGNYQLETETCVELVDLLFYKKNSEKSTISRLHEVFEGYSDYMLRSYMKLGLDPNDNLMQELIELDLDHGVTVDELVTSGWFYYHKWPLIQGLEHIIFKSKTVYDIMFKVALEHNVSVLLRR